MNADDAFDAQPDAGGTRTYARTQGETCALSIFLKSRSTTICACFNILQKPDKLHTI